MLLLKCAFCGHEFESRFLMSPEQFAAVPADKDTKHYCPHCQRSGSYRKSAYYFAAHPGRP